MAGGAACRTILALGVGWKPTDFDLLRHAGGGPQDLAENGR